MELSEELSFVNLLPDEAKVMAPVVFCAVTKPNCVALAELCPASSGGVPLGLAPCKGVGINAGVPR